MMNGSLACSRVDATPYYPFNVTLINKMSPMKNSSIYVIWALQLTSIFLDIDRIFTSTPVVSGGASVDFRPT